MFKNPAKITRNVLPRKEKMYIGVVIDYIISSNSPSLLVFTPFNTQLHSSSQKRSRIYFPTLKLCDILWPIFWGESWQCPASKTIFISLGCHWLSDSWEEHAWASLLVLGTSRGGGWWHGRFGEQSQTKSWQVQPRAIENRAPSQPWKRYPHS